MYFKPLQKTEFLDFVCLVIPGDLHRNRTQFTDVTARTGLRLILKRKQISQGILHVQSSPMTIPEDGKRFVQHAFVNDTRGKIIIDFH